MQLIHQNMSNAWAHLLSKLLRQGHETSPRGMKTLEILNNTLAIDMKHPVLVCPERKLSYVFMAAEALWMLDGDDSVTGIAPYNKNISQFSDDGEKFYGAYGPSIAKQRGYVINSLLNDVDTRQAVLTLWHQNPIKSKDIPCTVAMTFNIRAGKLNCHVFMRSSDAWLGVPYDFFNFTVIAASITWAYNQIAADKIGLGTLYWTAASSHIYEPHFEAAQQCLDAANFKICDAIPDSYITAPMGYTRLRGAMLQCRDKLEPAGWKIRP